MARDTERFAPYLAALLAWRRLVIGLPIALAVATLTTIVLLPRTFAARAAFVSSEPASLSSSLGALSSIAAQLGVPGLSQLAGGSASASPQFYADLLTSNALLQAVVTTKFDASAVADVGGEPFTGTLVEYLDPRGDTETDRVAEAMKVFTRSHLDVSADRPTGIVRFEVRTKNRQLSGLIARRMLELVNEFNLRRRQSQAGAERDFAAARATTAADTLRVVENALADFRATNIDFSHSPALAAREAQLQRRVLLAQQLYTTIAQRHELASMEAVRNTPVVTVLDPPEDLVVARPRYRVYLTTAAFVLGLLIACVAAFRAERVPALE